MTLHRLRSCCGFERALPRRGSRNRALSSLSLSLSFSVNISYDAIPFGELPLSRTGKCTSCARSTRNEVGCTTGNDMQSDSREKTAKLEECVHEIEINKKSR